MRKIFGLLAVAAGVCMSVPGNAGTCCNNATTVCVVCSEGKCAYLIYGEQVPCTPEQARRACANLADK